MTFWQNIIMMMFFNSFSVLFCLHVSTMVDGKKYEPDIILQDNCFHQKDRSKSNIQNALAGAFPYQVSIRVGNNLEHDCGGSIINNQWILTAAHCLFGRKLEDVSIVVGSNKLDSGGELYVPTKFVIHPKYNLSGIIHDIGLIMVNETIKFNDRIKTIDLPTFAGDEERKYKYAVISGWGRISMDYQYPNDLKYVEMCLLDLKMCSESVIIINAFQKICTIPSTNQGICFGVSGGPLVANGIQIGIASYIHFHCGYGYPDVYTRVSYYLEWISNSTKQKIEYERMDTRSNVIQTVER